MNAYHNMSCPPKSTMQKVIKPVGQQIVFNFKAASLHVPGDRMNLSDENRNSLIQKWLSEFIQKHQDEFDSVVRPMGYMIGSVFQNDNNCINSIETQYPGWIYCVDPLLTIAILCRMSGNIYIPQREPRLTCHSNGYDNIVIFPAKDFSDINTIGGQP